MQAELKVVAGKQQGKVIPLTMKKFLIGREKDCHLRPNNDLISRHHCVLTVDEFTVRIRDLGSTNGTYVNSERIQGQVVLQHGDLLSIGKLQFAITIRDVAVAGTDRADAKQELMETDAFNSQPTPPPTSGGLIADDILAEAEPAGDAGETISLPVSSDDVDDAPSGVYGGDTALVTPDQQEGHSTESESAAEETLGAQAEETVGAGAGVPQYAPQPQQMPMMPGNQYMPQGMPQHFPMPYMQQMPMMPGQYPQMPMMPQYPQQMPMMPQPVQMAPQQQAPPAPPQPEAPAQESISGGSTKGAEVRLPNPEETGAKAASDNVGSTGAPEKGKSTEVDPRAAAADIIRQYTHRPPGQQN